MATASPGGVTPPDDSTGSGSTASTSTGSQLNGMTSVTISQTEIVGTPLLPYAPVNMITKTITASTAFYDSPLLVLADATAGSIVVTLPVSGSGIGKLCVVMKTDSTANTVTINAASGESIYKLASFTNLSSQYQAGQFIGVKVGTFNGWVKVA